MSRGPTSWKTSAISDIGAYSAGSWTARLHLPVRLLR